MPSSITTVIGLHFSISVFCKIIHRIETRTRCFLVFRANLSARCFRIVVGICLGDEDLFIGEAELYKRTKGESSCRDISLWLPTATSMLTGSTTESITTDDDSDESSSLLSVPLLGGYSRRGCEEDSVDMLVNCSKAKQTLTSQYDIYAVENLKC